MALVKCYVCGKLISDKAAICPACGSPMVKQSSFGGSNQFRGGDEETVMAPPSAGFGRQPIREPKSNDPKGGMQISKGVVYTLIALIALLSVGVIYLLLDKDSGRDKADSELSVADNRKLQQKEEPNQIETSEEKTKAELEEELARMEAERRQLEEERRKAQEAEKAAKEAERIESQPVVDHLSLSGKMGGWATRMSFSMSSGTGELTYAYGSSSFNSGNWVNRTLSLVNYDPSSGKLVLSVYNYDEGRTTGKLDGKLKNGVYTGRFKNVNGQSSAFSFR